MSTGVSEILTERRRHMGTAVERNDARVVNLLHLDRDELRRLDDVIDAHVCREQIGKSVGDAAIRDRQILRRTWTASKPTRPGGTERLPVGGQRRKLSVRRVHNERRAMLEESIGKPVLTVCPCSTKRTGTGVSEESKVQRIAEDGV
jgi:hypothetical protein